MLSGTAVEVEVREQLREEDWQHLHRRLKAGAKRRVELEAIEADLLLEAEETRLFRRLGYPTMQAYMEAELDYGRHAANERLRVAHELGELPQIAERFRAGALSFSKVRALSRVVTEDSEDEWLAASAGKSAGEIEQLVKGRRKGDLPTDRVDPALVNERIVVEVSAETYALWRQVRVAIDDERGEHVSDDELVRTLCWRALGLADVTGPVESAALAPVVSGALVPVESAAHAPVVSSANRPRAVPRPVHHIAVTTCRRCKAAFQIGPGIEVELSAAALARAQCDALHVGDLERDTRTRARPEIPWPTRRKVFMRDRYACTVPGCTSRRWLEAHHVRPRAEGGGHQLWNLTLLCDAHHKLLHEGVIALHGRAPDQLVFERPAID